MEIWELAMVPVMGLATMVLAMVLEMAMAMGVAMDGVLAAVTALAPIATTMFVKLASIIDASIVVIPILCLMADVQWQRVKIYRTAKDWYSATRTIAQSANAVGTRPVNHVHPTRIACLPMEIARTACADIQQFEMDFRKFAFSLANAQRLMTASVKNARVIPMAGATC